LGERVTDSLRYLFPVGIIVFDTWWQIETIPLDDILYRKVKCKMIRKKEILTRT